MATNLALDNTLIEEAKDLGGHRTKKAAVNEALQEYVNRKKRLAFLELLKSGTIHWDPDYNYKAQRRQR